MFQGSTSSQFSNLSKAFSFGSNKKGRRKESVKKSSKQSVFGVMAEGMKSLVRSPRPGGSPVPKSATSALEDLA